LYIGLNGKEVDSGFGVNLFFLIGNSGKVVEELFVEIAIIDKFFLLVINCKESYAEFEPVGGLEYFGEVELKFLDVFDLFKVDSCPEVPLVLLFDKRHIVQLGFWLLHNCRHRFLLNIVRVYQSVVVPAEQMRLQNQLLNIVVVPQH
jgi:hypothetical protein